MKTIAIMNETPKIKSRWRILRRLLIALAVLATLPAIFYTEENWRGKRAWENYKHAAELCGESFDWHFLSNSTIPDDRNFFCAPIVAGILNRERNKAAWQARDSNRTFDIYRGNSANWPTRGGNWQQGELTDLKQWQVYFRNFNASPEGQTNGFPAAPRPQTPAADVLVALSGFNPALEELRQASLRPGARIPLNYEAGFGAAKELLPWLAQMKSCAQFLQLRILAELQNQQGTQALADLKLLIRVNDCVREQPFLISHLVRIAIMNITLQPVYEGLALHGWTDGQLAELEQTLAGQDFLADFQFALKGEKIFALEGFEKQRLTRETQSVDDSFGTNRITTVSLRWLPAAYFYQNQLCAAQLYQQFSSSLADVTNRIVSPAALNRLLAEMPARLKGNSPYKMQALMTAPAVAMVIKKFARVQAQVDLARVACALERYRQAQGTYPEQLAVLAPQWIEKLPHDLINGEPLHYRRAEAGTFVLYSVGWDEKDDGGKAFLTKGGSVDREKGDWVWGHPSK